MEIKDTQETLHVTNAGLAGSTFHDVALADTKFEDACMHGAAFHNVSLAHAMFTDINLSDIEISGAQMGGAYLHCIGLPPSDHPAHSPEQGKQRPVRFERCDLNESTFTHCDLSGVEITDCQISGLKINGVAVEDLLRAHAGVG